MFVTVNAALSLLSVPLLNASIIWLKRETSLDLATGLGANALFLARKGFSVFAVDISDIGLASLTHRHSNLLPICMDLDTWDIPSNFFDLIINIRFLKRCLFPQIIDGLKPGGVLIAETYLANDPGDSNKRSSYRSYFLQENELLHAFLPLKLIYYHEEPVAKEGEKGRSAGLVGIKQPMYR
jgi:SAM-dependent methyltransferase